jgi:hypothetical protein
MAANGVHQPAFLAKGTVPVVSPIPPFATAGTVPFRAPLFSQEHHGFFESEILASRKFRLNPKISRSKKAWVQRTQARPIIFALDYDARRNGVISPFVSGCALAVATFCARAESSFVCSERVLYALRAQALQISTSSDGV